MAVVLVTGYSGVTPNTDITKGVSDRFRSLPIWRPARGALLGDTGRYLLASAIVMALGLALGFRPAGASAACWRRWGSSWRSRSACVVGLDSSRLGAARTELGLQREPGDHVPPHPGQQRVRGPAHHAGMAAGVHRRQPDH